jgi:hypothetical protein
MTEKTVTKTYEHRVIRTHKFKSAYGTPKEIKAGTVLTTNDQKEKPEGGYVRHFIEGHGVHNDTTVPRHKVAVIEITTRITRKRLG